LFIKGVSPWNKGIKYDDNQKINIVQANKSDIKRKKQSKSISNRIQELGYRYTEEQKKKISDTCKRKGIKPKEPFIGIGENNPSFGKPVSMETRKKISNKLTGRKDSTEARINKQKGQKERFKDHVYKTEPCENIRKILEWRLWREFVFERDNYTCQECGNKGIYLEPHHIIPIRESISRVFDINNGIALCRPCHQKTFRKEKLFEDKYSQIANKA